MRQVVPIERLSCWYIFRLWARQKGQSSTRAAKFVVCCDCPTEWLMNVSVLDWAYNIHMAIWQSLILVNGQTKCWAPLIASSSMGRMLAVMGYLWGYSLSSKPTLIIHSIAALNIKCFDRDKWKKNLHHLHCFLFVSFTKTSINFFYFLPVLPSPLNTQMKNSEVFKQQKNKKT